jgi:hypothetical protein
LRKVTGRIGHYAYGHELNRSRVEPFASCRPSV